MVVFAFARASVHHPIIGNLIVLVALAGCTLLIRFNYDDLKTVPQHVESVKGYEATDRHFDERDDLMVLFIKSPRPSDTARLPNEMMSREIAELPNIVMVRGLTRSNGEP